MSIDDDDDDDRLSVRWSAQGGAPHEAIDVVCISITNILADGSVRVQMINEKFEHFNPTAGSIKWKQQHTFEVAQASRSTPHTLKPTDTGPEECVSICERTNERKRKRQTHTAREMIKYTFFYVFVFDESRIFTDENEDEKTNNSTANRNKCACEHSNERA